MLSKLASVGTCVTCVTCAVIASSSHAQIAGDLVQHATSAVSGPVAREAAHWSWVSKLPDAIASAPERGEGLVVPDRFRAIKVDLAGLRAALATAPLERVTLGGAGPDAEVPPVVVALPLPDGEVVRVALFASPIMSPAMAARHPEIKTYSGRGVDDRSIVVRLELTPYGLGAILRTPQGTARIDPFSRADASFSTASWWRDVSRGDWACVLDEDALPARTGFGAGLAAGPGRYGARTGQVRREFRVAVSATGEYTQFHGGTVSYAIAAIATTINRVNMIFESDHAVRLILVSDDDDAIVFVNPATDPFTNQSAATDIVTNQTLLDGLIGPDNYDIGHVFGTSGGGIAAGIGTACVNGLKGQGYSGVSPAAGDGFAVDYVAHELGHQLGARHTFNNCRGNTGDSFSICHEPGSGSTVMAYAGLCGATNLQSNSDPYFHSTNIEQVEDFLEDWAPCAVSVPLANNEPAVVASSIQHVPRSTLFTLVAAGSDPDDDPLTYSWEQRDGGPPASFPLQDSGTGPLFRAFAPSSSPARTFPRLKQVLEGTLPAGEAYATTDRTMTFRVTARDNALGGGATAYADTSVVVHSQAGPFRVLRPQAGASWSGTRVVTWDVAGTDQPPLSTSAVSILLSTDGGQTFPYELATSTPNDGAEVVTMPTGVSTSSARLIVRAEDGIYFDVNDGEFSIDPAQGSAVLVGTGVVTIDDQAGNGNANGAVDPGENAIAVALQITNDGVTTASNITGELISLTPGVTVIQPFVSYPTLDSTHAAFGLAPFVISVDPSHPCGEPILLRALLSSSAGGGLVEFCVDAGTAGPVGAPQTFSYAGPSVAIPDNNSVGVLVPVTVSGLAPGAIVADIDFRFDGTACSSAAGATGVGLSHTWVGDLRVSLISPDGTEVTLIDQAGGPPLGSSGNNFCQTRLDDDGPWSSIQTIPTSGSGAPYVGQWTPANPLSGFDGVQAEGVWGLAVKDLVQFDTGRVRSFSLIISPRGAPVCTQPTANRCYADFNQDGNEDITDAQLLAQVVAGLVAWQPGWLAGDFNGDENVDITDAQQLAQYVVTGNCPL
jgi:subtilisin-like proprotein convertase family protein